MANTHSSTKYRTIDFSKVDMRTKKVFTDDMAYSAFNHSSSMPSETVVGSKTKAVSSTRKINTSTHPKFH